MMMLEHYFSRCPDISNAILNAVYGKSFVTSENNSIISGARLGSGSRRIHEKTSWKF